MSCGLALYVLQSHQSKFLFFLSDIILTSTGCSWKYDLENGAGTSPKVVNIKRYFLLLGDRVCVRTCSSSDQLYARLLELL
ncbi:hypothetical protein AXX17_AT3G03910 [Arabidopsis thaliana]|uniref:Uncharacterized protein n=1 Tax=Arabidopsis thaliana TaxID=3702 RepID=A0A178VCK5_ARATH|nr:hypothetical protein AXX17_AT3G03910 [Arabidopsis thaliana]